MTERIKLTEDDIDIVHSVDNDNECIVKFTSLEGDEIIWTAKQATQLRQQLLDDQEKAGYYDNRVSFLDEYQKELKQLKEENKLQHEALNRVSNSNENLKQKLKKIKELVNGSKPFEYIVFQIHNELLDSQEND